MYVNIDNTFALAYHFVLSQDMIFTDWYESYFSLFPTESVPKYSNIVTINTKERHRLSLRE